MIWWILWITIVFNNFWSPKYFWQSRSTSQSHPVFLFKGRRWRKTKDQGRHAFGSVFRIVFLIGFLLFSYCFLIENIWFSIWLTKWQLSIRARIRIRVFSELHCEWRARGARSKRVASREQETLKPKHYGIPSRSWRLGGIANYAASGALGARARSEWRLGNKKP